MTELSFSNYQNQSRPPSPLKPADCQAEAKAFTDLSEKDKIQGLLWQHNPQSDTEHFPIIP